nr:family 31 glucosidase [Lachnospiraceae bacterium]
MFYQDGNALVLKKGGETVRIEGWGKNALRIRATRNNEFSGNLWALCPKDELPADQTNAKVEITEQRAVIKNGSTSASVSSEGIITYYKNDEFLMREYFSNYGGTENNAVSCFKRVNREYKPHLNGDFK